MGIKVPPSGTHGAGAPAVMNRVLAPLMRLQIASTGGRREAASRR